MQTICGKYQDASRRLESNRKDRRLPPPICSDEIETEINAKTALWTKSYLINLHCVHIRTYNLYLSLHFSNDWLLFVEKIFFLTQSSLDCSALLFLNLLFRLRFGQQFWEKSKIKLMFFPKSHVLFAEEGRPVGPIDWWCAMIEMTMHAMGSPWGQVAPGWFLRCPGWQREPRGTGVYTYHLSNHHATTRAQWYVVNPGEIPVIGLLCVSSSSWSLGEKKSERKREREKQRDPTAATLSVWETLCT